MNAYLIHATAEQLGIYLSKLDQDAFLGAVSLSEERQLIPLPLDHTTFDLTQRIHHQVADQLRGICRAQNVTVYPVVLRHKDGHHHLKQVTRQTVPHHWIRIIDNPEKAVGRVLTWHHLILDHSTDPQNDWTALR